jgi:8-oxo-dGTP pyrophosphatase MutT (NUDIX family)
MGNVEKLDTNTTLDQFKVEVIGNLQLSRFWRLLVLCNWWKEKYKNRSLTNDPIHFVAQEFTDDQQNRVYLVYRSTYRVFKFLRKFQSLKTINRWLKKYPWLRKISGLETLLELYLVNVVSVLEGKDFLFFAKSGPNTHHAGKISPIGGMLDHENMEAANPFYSNYSKELKEEAGLEADNPEHVTSFYVAYLGRRNSKSVELIVLAQTPLSREQLLYMVKKESDGEFSEVKFLPKKTGDVEKFLHSDTPRWENLNPLLRKMFDLHE